MINLEKAHKIIEAAEKKANELKVKVSIAVVDEHGMLVALHRMDGAFYISPSFANAKAHTSALLKMPSGEIAPYAGNGKPYFGISTAFGGEILPMAGGLPIKEGDNIIGAVGVGGSINVSEDLECAKAGAAAYKAG